MSWIVWLLIVVIIILVLIIGSLCLYLWKIFDGLIRGFGR